MNKFVDKESLLHKNAKELLKEWLDKDNNLLNFQSNETHGVHVEYPICINDKINTWTTRWYLYYSEFNFDVPDDEYFTYVPTYKEYIEIFKCKPIAIIDLVCTHKGQPHICVEIVHKNKVSDDKAKKLLDAGIDNLYEISAYWVLSQVEKPKEIKYNVLI